MRFAITLLLFLHFGTVYAQTKAEISIRHRQEKYYLSKTCYDYLSWDEVLLANKAIGDSINRTIRTAVKVYKLGKDDADVRCDGTMEYETECNIVYARNGLVSCYMTAFTYFKGSPHGYRQFNTLNFNARTGRQLNFHDFIDTNKIAAIDTLIMQKTTERLKGFYSDMSSWREQLPDLSFTIGDKGIEILFRSEIYVLSIIEIPFSYDELKPFVRKNGLLSKMYP